MMNTRLFASTMAMSMFVIFFLVNSCAGLKETKIKTKKHFVGPRIVWTKNLDPKYSSGNLPISMSGPLLHEGILYQASADGAMNAYKVEDGVEIWKGKGLEYDSRSAPVIFEDHVIYGNVSGRIYSRNRFSGELKYSVDLGSSIESVPTIHKGRAYFHLRNHTIISIDAKTGKILWSYKRSVPMTTTLQRASQVLPHGNKLFVGMADGFVICLDVNEGRMLWERKLATASKFIDVDVRPYVRNSKLYIGSLSSAFSILNINDGQLIKRFLFTAQRGPLEYENKLYVPSSDGSLVVINEIDKVEQKISLSEYPLSSIELWKNYLVVGSMEGKLFFLNKENNTVRFQHSLGSYASSINSDFATDDNHLAVYSSRNRLYVFRDID